MTTENTFQNTFEHTLISQSLKTFVTLQVETSLKDIESAEAPRIYTPATEEQFGSIGFIPFEEGDLVKTINNIEVVTVGQSFRKVNKKKVKRLVKEKIAKLKEEFIPTAEQEEFTIDKETIKDLEHQVAITLLPETEVDETVHYVIRDIETNFLFVTNANKKVSEDITAFIRYTLGSFPVEEITDEETFAQSFKKVLKDGKAINRISFGDYIVMMGLGKEKALFSKVNLFSDEVQDVLTDKSVTSIGLDFDGVLALTAMADLSFKGMKLEKDFFDPESSFLADVLLVSNELVGFTEDLLQILE